VAIVRVQAFAGSSRGAIVDRHIAMRAEPHASCWICRFVWQQSVALFNEVWEQKLTNNSNYCFNNINTNTTSQW